MSENETQRRKGTPLKKGVKQNMGYGSGSGTSGTVGCDQATHVLHVDGKRTDSYTPNGSIARPYKTVQAALDRAAGLLDLLLSPASFGVTISIAAGHYNEDCAFVFPADFRRLDICSAGGRGSVSLRSLEVSPSATATGDTRNYLNLHRIDHGNTIANRTPLHLHNGGVLHACLWGCRMDLAGQDFPLCVIGDDGGTGAVYAHFYDNCRLIRENVPAEGTTPTILFHEGDSESTLDFQGRVRQSGGTGPLTSASGDIKIDVQDSSLIHSNGSALACDGSVEATVIDSRIETGEHDAIVHTGSFGTHGARVIADGVFFFLTTGQAITAAAGALVGLGGVSWDGALAGYGDITSKITVAVPALLKRLQSAAVTGYTPTQTANWNTTPADIKMALDELASRIKALEA